MSEAPDKSTCLDDAPGNHLYILQNQDDLFLGKNSDWTDGTDPRALFKTRHKDEALNQLFEVNSKDYTQRIQLICCPEKGRGLPDIDPDIMPPPLPKQAPAAEAANTEAAEPEVDNGNKPANYAVNHN